MRAKELLEILKQVDPDAEILMWQDSEDQYGDYTPYCHHFYEVEINSNGDVELS